MPAGLVEGYVRADLRAIAAQAPPQCPPSVLASGADGFLTVFNLSDADVTGTVHVRGSRLYRGTQVTTAGGISYDLTLPAATARVEAPWFTVRGIPAGITARSAVRRGSRDPRAARCGSCWAAATAR
ncbi:hypothetical protein BBK82_29365 [Lentzea guizhouensis]|uniref:Uncharacterized protein n=1 Tax=Lentzea guizhouensis TaxID=1586287 RepID=A0A1B2HPA3_9PSEU|nr:hypothetical protein [Lentzea guizhouensis]ANZ39548.1 hypothetical protein BBK82_29365 [Lentzea guizhouensis]